MDALQAFLQELRLQGLDRGHSLGLFHVLVGCRLTRADGSVVSNGQTWRAAAALLKKARWPKEAVVELGLDAAKLPPRDRAQFWYAAIAQARIDSPEAKLASKELATRLVGLGYVVG